jgi:hypothetical protein
MTDFTSAFLVVFFGAFVFVYVTLVVKIVKKITNAPDFVDNKSKYLFYGAGIGSVVFFLAFFGCFLYIIIHLFQGDSFVSLGMMFLGFFFFAISTLLGWIMNRMIRE